MLFAVPLSGLCSMPGAQGAGACVLRPVPVAARPAAGPDSGTAGAALNKYGNSNQDAWSSALQTPSAEATHRDVCVRSFGSWLVVGSEALTTRRGLGFSLTRTSSSFSARNGPPARGNGDQPYGSTLARRHDRPRDWPEPAATLASASLFGEGSRRVPLPPKCRDE